MADTEKYIGESLMEEKPSKKIIFSISDGAVTAPKIADGAVTNEKIADLSISNEKLKELSIAWSKLSKDVQTIIASREEGGVALSTEFGDSELVGMTQKKLTEVYNEMLETISTTSERTIQEVSYLTNLINEAIGSLTVSEQEALRYAEDVVKHGRAITQIAGQLGATYNNDGREEADEYTPGYKFTLIEEEDMEVLQADPSQAEEGMIYMQMEPLEDEEE